MKTCIFVRSQFEAIHYWADAPEEVGFLRHPHRHMFHVEVELQVTDLDRELEFFLVKAKLDHLLEAWNNITVLFSCEKFCSIIYRALSRPFPSITKVEVSEDGENGARLWASS